MSASVDVNPDLAKERQKATFDVRRASKVLYGSSSYEKRRAMVKLFEEQKDLPDSLLYHFLSRPEKYAEAMRKGALFMKLARKHAELDEEAMYYLEELIFPNEVMPYRLHLGMFIPMLKGQCTEEQKAKWLTKANNFEILGTYAQTELGHGTNVRGLETTATYDQNSDEFIMNSPTITSTKFWPGGLGKTCNFAVVMARLFIKGKFYGVQPFIVQLRDLTTHVPLPGVTVGDIGPKFGYDTIDNGFLRFNSVRIPRENMLMRNAKVLRDGTYVKVAQHDKLSYGTMLYTRAMLVQKVAAAGLAQAVTIGVRYSCVRRQSELKPGAQEAQIIEFQTQQYKLFPLVSIAYAYWFAGRQMEEAYFQLERELEADDTSSLPELHALSAGMKAIATAAMMDGIEQCRLACGGHGFSQASGLPKIYVHCTPACTYEGENTVMLLQTARFLVKAYQQAQSGAVLKGSVAYLTEKIAQRSCIDPSLAVASLVNAYKYRASRLLTKACSRIVRLQAEGKELYDAWNKSSVYLVKATEAHCQLWTLEAFAAYTSLDRTDGCTAVKDVITDLLRLYAAYNISLNSGDYSEDGYMNPEQLRAINDGVLLLLEKLRPNIVALVDAFDFTDRHLGSILGRFDGQVYENLFKWAAESPLNRTQVHESHKFLREMMSKL